MDPLVEYIMRWIRERNRGQLNYAFAKMRVEDYELLKEELAMILEHEGKPPNWVK